MSNRKEPIDAAQQSAEVIGCVQALEDAVKNLCHATVTGTHLDSADVDIALARLAAAGAALLQAAYRLNDIFDEARLDHSVAMNARTDEGRPFTSKRRSSGA